MKNKVKHIKRLFIGTIVLMLFITVVGIINLIFTIISNLIPDINPIWLGYGIFVLIGCYCLGWIVNIDNNRTKKNENKMV